MSMDKFVVMWCQTGDHFYEDAPEWVWFTSWEGFESTYWAWEDFECTYWAWDGL